MSDCQLGFGFVDAIAEDVDGMTQLRACPSPSDTRFWVCGECPCTPEDGCMKDLPAVTQTRDVESAQQRRNDAEDRALWPPGTRVASHLEMSRGVEAVEDGLAMITTTSRVTRRCPLGLPMSYRRQRRAGYGRELGLL